jgi:hypothetical protein
MNVKRNFRDHGHALRRFAFILKSCQRNENASNDKRDSELSYDPAAKVVSRVRAVSAEKSWGVLANSRDREMRLTFGGARNKAFS